MSAFSPEIAARAMMPREYLNEASSLHFAMHLSSGYIQVALAEASGSEFLWSEDFTIEQRKHSYADAVDFVSGRNWSEKVFRKCSLTFDTDEFTLVPNAFFDVAKGRDLLEFNTGKPSLLPAHLPLQEMDAVMIFNQDEYVRELSKQFPNVRIFPTAYLFIKNALARAERDETTLHLSRTSNHSLLAVVKNKKLLLLNHFDVQNEEDILYHASNAAMRLNIDFEHAGIELYEMPISDTLFPLLKKYNQHVSYAFNDLNKKVKASFPAHLHILCA